MTSHMSEEKAREIKEKYKNHESLDYATRMDGIATGYLLALEDERKRAESLVEALKEIIDLDEDYHEVALNALSRYSEAVRRDLGKEGK